MQNMETAQCAEEMAQAEKLLGGRLTPAEKSLVGVLMQTKALRSSAKDLFKIYRCQPYRFPDLMKKQIKSVELLEGKWDQVGSKRRWTFVDDQCGTWDDIVEDINDQAMSDINDQAMPVMWTLQKGIVPQQRYSILKVVHQFFVHKHGCLATVILVYKKKHAGIPAPNDYMEFLIKMLEAADRPPRAGTNEE